jgi:hypothetical protein
MKRLPTWLKIAIPVVLFLGLAGAAVVKVMVEELPEYAQVPAIQERFGEQIEILLELARASPSDGCLDEGSPREMIAEIELLKSWWNQAGEQEARFRDPAILGADVVFHCEGSTRSLAVKSYEEPTASWSRSAIFPSREWPSANLWYAGEKRLVRYEDRLEDAGESPRGIRLILDLERLVTGETAAPGSGSGAVGVGSGGGGAERKR